MRTVRTKKELIKAIEDGEKRIKIDSKNLYAACILAEKFDSKLAFLQHYACTSINDFIKPTRRECCFVCSSTVVVTITITVAITTISIIAILKNKRVKIKVKGVGDVEIS